VLNISVTYTQSGGGILNIDLGGTNAGTTYDVLNISGAASLGGTLNVDLLTGFTPVAGDSFDILNSSADSNMFTTTNLPTVAGDHWTISYNSTGVVLNLVAGPVPPGAANPASKGTISGAPATRASRSAGAVTSTTTNEPSAILAKATCFGGRLLGSESCGRETAATVASSGEAQAASSGGGEVHNNIMVATHSISARRGAASHETSASAMARLYVCAYFAASVGRTMGCN